MCQSVILKSTAQFAHSPTFTKMRTVSPYLSRNIASCAVNKIDRSRRKVKPPVISVVATELDALANAILPSDQSFAKIMWI